MGPVPRFLAWNCAALRMASRSTGLVGLLPRSSERTQVPQVQLPHACVSSLWGILPHPWPRHRVRQLVSHLLLLAARIIDSGLVQMVNENVWNSFNGLLEFDLFSYIRIASTQMRNIWVLTLFWKVVLSLHSLWMAGRARRWHSKASILAIRAFFISTASSLTIFSFLRASRFRETNILYFQMLPRHTRLNDESVTPAYVSDSEFGRMIDAKTVFLASLVVFSGVVILQLAVKLIIHRTPNFAFCRSSYIPLSAGALYPKSMQGIF